MELFKFKPHKRSWILQAIKRFGDYYFRKYNNREVTQLRDFHLNKDLDMKDHIYLVSPQFIEEKVKKIILLPGEIGFIARLWLLSGLREQGISGTLSAYSNNVLGASFNLDTLSLFII